MLASGLVPPSFEMQLDISGSYESNEIPVDTFKLFGDIWLSNKSRNLGYQVFDARVMLLK